MCPCVSCSRIRGPPAPAARADPEYLFPDAAARLERRGLYGLSRQRGARVHPRGRRAGHRYFPHFRFAELAAQHEGRDGSRAARRASVCEAAICYTGDILDPQRDKYPLQLLRAPGQGTGANGRAYPGHQGYGRACASLTPPRSWSGRCAKRSAADPFPHARHQRHQRRFHPQGGGSGRGRRRCRRSFDERHHQPAESEFGGRRARAHAARHRDWISTRSIRYSDYWEAVRAYYEPFDNAPPSPAPPKCTSTKCPAASTPT